MNKIWGGGVGKTDNNELPKNDKIFFSKIKTKDRK